MPGLLGQVQSTVDQASHPTPRSWHTGPQSLRARKPAPTTRRAPCSGPPVVPPVTAPRQPVRPVLRPTVSAQLQGAHLPTPATRLGPLSLPGPALQALWHYASHVFPARVSVSVCLSVPGCQCLPTQVPTVGSERKRNTECVSVCRLFNLFLSFLHRPCLPCHLAFLPTTTLSLSPLLLSTLSCRVAVAATAPAPPPLAVLVVRQDTLDTSFISSPCTIEFTFALRTPRLENNQDTPYIPPTYPQSQPPKNIVISSHLASFQHNFSPPATTKTFDCARRGYLEEVPSSRKPRL